MKFSSFLISSILRSFPPLHHHRGKYREWVTFTMKTCYMDVFSIFYIIIIDCINVQ
jgi:hypothetical protein